MGIPDAELVDPSSASAERCPICFEVFLDPCECKSCQGGYCRKCLETCVDARQVCPLCKVSMCKQDIGEAHRHRREAVERLQVRCMAEDCFWTGRLDRRAGHTCIATLQAQLKEQEQVIEQLLENEKELTEGLDQARAELVAVPARLALRSELLAHQMQLLQELVKAQQELDVNESAASCDSSRLATGERTLPSSGAAGRSLLRSRHQEERARGSTSRSSAARTGFATFEFHRVPPSQSPFVWERISEATPDGVWTQFADDESAAIERTYRSGDRLHYRKHTTFWAKFDINAMTLMHTVLAEEQGPARQFRIRQKRRILEGHAPKQSIEYSAEAARRQLAEVVSHLNKLGPAGLNLANMGLLHMAWSLALALARLDRDDVMSTEFVLSLGERQISLKDVGKMFIERAPEEMRSYAVLLAGMRDDETTTALLSGESISREDLQIKAKRVGSITDAYAWFLLSECADCVSLRERCQRNAYELGRADVDQGWLIGVDSIQDLRLASLLGEATGDGKLHKLCEELKLHVHPDGRLQASAEDSSDTLLAKYWANACCLDSFEAQIEGRSLRCTWVVTLYGELSAALKDAGSNEPMVPGIFSPPTKENIGRAVVALLQQEKDARTVHSRLRLVQANGVRWPHDCGRPAWYCVLVLGSLKYANKYVKRTEQFPEYGKILQSGYGEAPPEKEVRQRAIDIIFNGDVVF